MIRRITLQNYMSHAHTVIEPADGLTVLVGPNNCGKSAVVSALETLCYNATGNYMVRHEENDARVTVETDDGHSFVWRRHGKVVSYVIDDREVHRVGRGVPEDLQKLLRLPVVEVGDNGEPFEIHFGNQKSPIFLLNESESRAALFFASSSDASVLLEMQKRHRNKVREARLEERRLRVEIDELDAEIESLKPVDAVAASTVQVEAQYRDFVESANRMRALGHEIGALDSMLVNHERLARECAHLVRLTPPPQLARTHALESLTIDVAAAVRRFQRDGKRYRVLEPLTAIPDLADAAALGAVVGSLVNAARTLAHRRQRWEVVRDLRPPPVLDDVKSAETLYRGLSREKEKLGDLLAKAKCLVHLREPAPVGETATVERILQDLKLANRSHESLRRRNGTLAGLAPLPRLDDTKPLEELLRQLEAVQARIDSDSAQADEVLRAMGTLDAELRDHGRASDELPAPPPAPWPRRSILVILIGTAAIVLLLISASPWIRGFVHSSSDRSAQPSERTNTPVAAANELKAKSEPVRQPVEKDALRYAESAAQAKLAAKSVPSPQPVAPNGKVLSNADSGTNGTHVSSPAVPTQEASKKDVNLQTGVKDRPGVKHDNEKRVRLKQIRKQLDDAATADKNGEYLNAVLGFGQAVLLYQQELSEVEDIETVRGKFTNALKHYQAEVERALLKAAERKAPEK